jgi:pimeloyl-ACP methyl ester carboxylesterase
MPIPLLFAEKLYDPEIKDPSIPGYFFMSTAPVNVEDAPRGQRPCIDLKQCIQNSDKCKSVDQCKNTLFSVIDEITTLLVENPDSAEIIIAIHGYNTEEPAAKEWCRDIYKYVNQQHSVDRAKGTVFIGYNWPSESFSSNYLGFFKRVFDEFRTLPILPGTATIFAISIIVGFTIFLINVKSSFLIILISILAIVFAIAFIGSICGIVLMKVFAYLRDAYRATNFGVLDLVELIRQLDNKIVDKCPEEDKNFWKKKKIKLTFIGHSMGGFVVTSVVRILSDVFDQASIEPICQDENTVEKPPSPDIGNVFSLERLVLVSPDIPLESIIPGRANFLRSSLRRFKESYLFSNEGDMILRAFSTAANYLSFSARTPDRSFRLGNVTLDHSAKDGIVNQDDDGSFIYGHGYPFLEKLFIGLNNKQKSLDELITSPQRRQNNSMENKSKSQDTLIAEYFTYFDCTNYVEKDKNGNMKGMVSRALHKETLGFWDCTCLLLWDSLLKRRDVHAGYFEGNFGKKTIYGLAFLGFEKFIHSLDASVPKDNLSREEKLNLLYGLSNQCEEKGIQVLLSPRQYEKLCGAIETSKSAESANLAETITNA